MKAAVYYGPGDMRIEERRKPAPGVDGAVVKVKDCGVCGFIDIPAWETPDLMGTGKSRGHEWSEKLSNWVLMSGILRWETAFILNRYSVPATAVMPVSKKTTGAAPGLTWASMGLLPNTCGCRSCPQTVL